MKTTAFPADFSALIAALEAEHVDYLVVGGYAVGAHGRPRATKDLDLWIAGAENLERVAKALALFGLSRELVEQARTLGDSEVLYFGRPPLRVDLLRTVSGLRFDDARRAAVRAPLGPHAAVPLVSLDDLITNKRAAGRPQDLADAAALEKIRAKRSGA